MVGFDGILEKSKRNLSTGHSSDVETIEIMKSAGEPDNISLKMVSYHHYQLLCRHSVNTFTMIWY